MKVENLPYLKIDEFSELCFEYKASGVEEKLEFEQDAGLQFEPIIKTQKLVNLNELDGILINMEHSFLGDITIAIRAPNGVKVYLKKGVGTTAGWESFLGEPVDEPFPNSPLSSKPGKGYDYLFSPNPKYGTMDFEKGKYKYSYTDKAGQKQVDHTYLPEGSYAADDSLSE